MSPEMQSGGLKNLPVIEIVASGLHDSIGLYKRPCPSRWLLRMVDAGVGISSLKDKMFLQISSGRQQLAFRRERRLDSG